MTLTETFHRSTLSFVNYTEAIEFAKLHHMEDSGRFGANKIERGTDDFTGTPNYEAAHKLASQGWAEGRETLLSLSQLVNCSGSIAKPEVIYDVTGNGGVDVGKALTGEPECFMDWQDSNERQATASGPIVHIVFNGSVAGGVDTDSIRYRGAAVLGLIDALESAGRRVEVTYIKANTTTGNGPDEFLIEIPLKSAEYSLQPDQLAFALVHPSMNRRIGFSLTYQCGVHGKRSAARGSYGGTTTYVPPNADIYLPRLDYTTAEVFSTPAAARTWLIARLTEQGITLEE